jgi:thymidylate synthase (FAD)
MHTTPKFGQPGNLTFKSQLENIEVKIFSAPTIEQFRKTISVFMMNTWNDKLNYDIQDEEAITTCIKELFAGNILPTGMETIGICWGVSGLDMIDTTHLIRHRLFSFSAQAHGDRDMRNDSVMVKESIYHSSYFDRYANIIKQAHQLYMDMMDSDEINCLDARTIMPRCFEHFYTVKCCIKDLISYCIMRGDEQIQTQVDNVVAMKLWLEILKLYPFLKGVVDFRKPDAFYIKQCKEGKTNIFPPNDKNNFFTWDKSQFYQPMHRDDYTGGDIYKAIREDLLRQMDFI